MKASILSGKRERGQAAIAVVLAMAVFLIGAVGLAIDGSHLYAERQMAQAAADAAAQAGIRSIFTGSYSDGSSQAFSTNLSSTDYTCASSDAQTPCYYAQTLNGFNGGGDTVSFKEPTAASLGLIDCGTAGTPLYCGGGANLLQVTVARQVPTTFFKFISSWTPTVKAQATGAIISVMSPVPIIVTHPTNPNTFKMNGGVTIRICGGPGLSIQVNSNSTSGTQGISGSSNVVDLTKAGPNDPGDCTTGTGAGFGNTGNPSSPAFNLQGLGLSTSPGVYYAQPSPPIDDPLANVPVPSKPAAGTQFHVAAGGTGAISSTYVTSGMVTCPASNAPGGCDFFLPGDYPSGISASGSNNYIAYFFPGLYYMDSNGFQGGSNGVMAMYSGANADATTGSGMVVYNTGSGLFVVGKNAGASLVGSDQTSIYKGILFFQDRSAPAHTTKNTDDHIIGGGGTLNLQGTIYINNQSSVVTSSHYQLLQLQGGGGSGTLIQGEIITNQLLLGGSGTITMNLNPNAVAPVKQIALVQ